MYFYHPDYLGSVEFVTDMRGDPYQFFFNTIWGENLQNQLAYNTTAFSSRFRFNGKEWDEETGNFYYGARYYDPKISVWLSVDPLASKYPYMSPYNFVENNPIVLMDPTGLGPEVFILGPDAEKATEELNKNTSLEITRDSKTGKLSATGEAKTDKDKALLEAINDKTTHVELNTIKKSNNQFPSQTGGTVPMKIGGNDGSYRKDGEKQKVPVSFDENGFLIYEEIQSFEIIGLQYINMVRSERAHNAGVSKMRHDVYHEIMESYIQAKLFPGMPYSKANFDVAHEQAHSLDKYAPRLYATPTGWGLVNPKNNKSIQFYNYE